MFGIFVKKVNSDVVIRWLLTKVTIPISDILAVTTDDTYGGKEKQAIRLGTPYGTTDRLVIITKENTYILFTTNYTSIQKKLNSYIQPA
ncbi:hypothetical protein QL992_13385 [Microbacterium sp. APC 3898]|uniref:Sublancin immunity protein SunI-like PH domain-containing protein n=1 Tax=Planococcus notacanthi TaxID=3035188 RepID=A0ABT7ZHQ2_9BACL|nr:MULTISPECIES: hypothetical protein [Terrabacteria group]MDN3426695.1 hypothetical protein [Planococcus sp. APC 4016]MDN3500205.1 hypothetical protein [Microbacterium sp. APC 3898]